MKSSYSTFDNIYILRLHPQDIECIDLGKQCLSSLGEKTFKGVVISVMMFEIITTDDIKLIESLVNIFKLNNLHSIVCDFSVFNASILFHFIDSISFQTTLDMESAVNVFKYN
ncbi:MAG: hypothetical protein PHF17_10145 [Arcobacteraceae bacterium]|jgi:hypothetical protein|nr:hypothetical protein [Arcobacteraceae bacterium]